MDVLAMQASAVPSERVFSSAADTDTADRNRLAPALMEAIQVLKFSSRQDRISFMEELLGKEEDYSIDGELTDRAFQEITAARMWNELADLEWNAAHPSVGT